MELNSKTANETVRFSIKVGDGNNSWIEDYEYNLADLVRGFSENLVNKFNKTEERRYGEGAGNRELIKVIID